MHMNRVHCVCEDCLLRNSWAEYRTGDYVTLKRWEDDLYTHEIILTFSDIEFTRSYLTSNKYKEHKHER